MTRVDAVATIGAMDERFGAPADGTSPADDGGLDFGPLDGLIGYHLRRAQARVFADFMAAMAEDGVTPGQFGVLTLIDANSGLSQSSLAKALGIERSTMVEVIDRLEAQGLVARRKSPRDRRSYALDLTDVGRARLADLRPKVRRHEARIAAGLTADEVRVLTALLRRIGPG